MLSFVMLGTVLILQLAVLSNTKINNYYSPPGSVAPHEIPSGYGRTAFINQLSKVPKAPRVITESRKGPQYIETGLGKPAIREFPKPPEKYKFEVAPSQYKYVALNAVKLNAAHGSFTKRNLANPKEYTTLTSKEFKGWTHSHFPGNWKDGKYAFIVTQSQPDNMRVRQMVSFPFEGHLSMLSEQEQIDLLQNKLQLKYGGAFTLNKGQIMDWTNDCVDLCVDADPRMAALFARYWGLDAKAFSPVFCSAVENGPGYDHGLVPMIEDMHKGWNAVVDDEANVMRESDVTYEGSTITYGQYNYNHKMIIYLFMGLSFCCFMFGVFCGLIYGCHGKKYIP